MWKNEVTYQDDRSHEEQIHEEISRRRECCGSRFKGTAVGVEEIWIHQHSQFRAREDECREAPP